MPTISFSHPADVFDFTQLDPETDEDGLLVEDPVVLRSLDGLQYTEEVFSDYLGDGGDADISEVGITGGSLSFVFDAPSSQLMVSTTFMLARTLTAAEIELLRDFTSGQWSDGIGENFFQERMSHGLAPHAVPTDDEDIHITQGS